MLRILINNVIQTNKSVFNISNNPINVQTVRWRRKPRWLPVAKSKVFRVPERKKQNEDEKIELLRLHNNYRTYMRSLRAYLREENELAKATTTSSHLVLTPEEEKAELEKCIEINVEWNAKCEEIRNDRLKRESEEREQLIMQRLEDKEIREQMFIEKAEEVVRYEKEQSKTFIGIENLDQAIEYALSNPVDYNFAIDLDHNIYHGRNTPAVVQKEDASKAALQALM